MENRETKPLTFQQIILRLQDFWANRGCVIWQPYAEKVGAGTLNPATVLRVLGPEPWNVGYVEPSYRPADGRYGENPNRMQYYYQYQVILKPDPGDPQEVYLESLYALGLRREEHDIRFVEDNWDHPALGAWGLGWEVWMDGQEITQFTYFQQAGGVSLDPVAVELTYGLERIAMYLQGVRSVWEIDWDGRLTYGEILLQSEIENCRYGFELADVDALQQMYDLFESEAHRCLDAGLVIPAHDYVLRCSHTFNLMDARGAIGVTERATFFRRMRELSRRVAETYLEQRERMEYPFLEETDAAQAVAQPAGRPSLPEVEEERPFLLEIGTEELPPTDLSLALEQLQEQAPARFEDARLDYERLEVLGTPRRQVVLVKGLAPRQRAVEELVKGPPARVAFDDEGRPTRAAQGFARKFGVDVGELEVREVDGGEYVVAVHREQGRPTAEVLQELLPELIDGLHFPLSMRWNATNVTFSRPIRWLVALLGQQVIPFSYAGVTSGRTSRGSRPEGSPEIELQGAEGYAERMAEQRILVDPAERRAAVAAQVDALASEVGGHVPPELLDGAGFSLLDEVTNLVEEPTAFVGQFEEGFLELPDEVLVAVMKKHQRYFPVYDDGDQLLPYFVAVRNGGTEHMDTVRHGNEEVIRARFADGSYFFQVDTRQELEDFLPRLDTLTFQEELGSMLDKARRLEQLAEHVADMLDRTDEEVETAVRVAHLCKADLATQMVIEFTSLQGVMGREYALRSGEPLAVAQGIYEHYLPRSAGDEVPEGSAGMVVGLADRLDSLAGLFAVGLAPTGSADPYGLRREALGMVQLLIEKQLPFSVHEGLAAAAEFLPVPMEAGALEAARDFVTGRLRVLLRERFRYDVVDAVLAARGEDPYRARVAAGQLSRRMEREDWPHILDNYARCVRITRDAEQRFELDPEDFVRPAEHELYEAYVEAREQITERSSVEDFFVAFMPLVERIDYFFARESGVLVMAEEQRLRENRLALLQRIAALADGIVDLSRVEGF